MLTNVAPGTGNIGRQFLAELCRFYPPGSLACFHTDHLPQEEMSPDLGWIPLCHGPAPSEYGWRPFRDPLLNDRVSAVTRPAYERWIIEASKIPALAEQAVAFGQQHGVDMVWAPLRTPTLVRLALPVAQGLGKPLVTTVWDPLRYTLAEYDLDVRSLERVHAQAERTLRLAVRNGVASDGMKDRYESRYGTPCVPMIYAPRLLTATEPHLPVRKRSDEIVIGFAGSIYARDAWQALLDALDACRWCIGGRDVRIQMLGSHFDQRSLRPLRIEYLGWHDPPTMVTALAQADVLYLPYWFSEEHSDTVELTFPNKIASYVAAGVPVFYHGPRRSTPARFLKQYPVGLACCSIEPECILQGLTKLVSEPLLREEARRACVRAREEVLNPAAFRSSFAALLGIEASDLTMLEPDAVLPERRVAADR